MRESESTIADEVERFLRTGETDPHHAAWSGGFMERANHAHEDLRGALVREVRRLAEGLIHKPLPQTGLVALTRGKVEPMVRGLFPRIEQDQVLATLEASVVFLTSANIEPLLLKHGFDSSAWKLANRKVSTRVRQRFAKSYVGIAMEEALWLGPFAVTRHRKVFDVRPSGATTSSR